MGIFDAPSDSQSTQREIQVSQSMRQLLASTGSTSSNHSQKKKQETSNNSLNMKQRIVQESKKRAGKYENGRANASLSTDKRKKSDSPEEDSRKIISIIIN